MISSASRYLFSADYRPWLSWPTIMTDQTILWLGLGFCLGLIFYLGLSQEQKDVVFRRFSLRVRRTSSSETPPRSLSPEKKVPGNSSPKSSEFVTTYPPSQRDTLKTLAPTLADEQREALGNLSFDEKDFVDKLMGFEEDFRTCDPEKYVASGFSVKEVNALGDFPDYSELSGVPDPEPYENFDLNKAIPRPYRPFRWAYHQTMCMSYCA